MIGPLIKLINPNISDMCAYAGAGFHNFLSVSLSERHPKEILKTAMSLLGTGQLSLTKVVVLLRDNVDPSDFRTVLREIWLRFDPEDHLLLLPFAPVDTLDFTSFTMHVGSKVIIDATGPVLSGGREPRDVDPRQFDRRIERYRLLEGGFLVIVVRESPREVLENLVKAPLDARFVIAVSGDVQLEDDENLLQNRHSSEPAPSTAESWGLMRPGSKGILPLWLWMNLSGNWSIVAGRSTGSD
jgi:3-polyprenyl-4-hydroxybenzoate decarboxylase